MQKREKEKKINKVLLGFEPRLFGSKCLKTKSDNHYTTGPIKTEIIQL